MKFKKILTVAITLMFGATMSVGLAGCSVESQAKEADTIIMVWYPNESGGDLEAARNEVGRVVEEASGKKVEHKLTTDYSVAIETIANGTAAIAFMGPQGYVEAHKKNDKLVPLVVPSGKSGTLDDAVYYSWLAVRKDKASEYKKDGNYVMDNIQGKTMSFVSNSSTSGFKIPTSSMVSYFSKKDKWKDIKAEDLIQGGSDKFFKEVLYGGSHQGSAVNLLSEKADVAAFCDTTMRNYCKAVEGEFNAVGTTYKISSDAAEPFNTLAGKEFTAIGSTPVLNSPFVVNTKVLSEDTIKKIKEYLISDKVTKNEKIFVPKGVETKGFFVKEGEEQFLEVKDEWFEPIRKLSE